MKAVVLLDLETTFLLFGIYTEPYNVAGIPPRKAQTNKSSNRGRGKAFSLFSNPSRPAMVSNQPPSQRMLGLSPPDKVAGL